ncbi:MAG TPA: DUF4097 family beta strand repeat-containing protein [Pyrinomonadaceae bacterium]|jgi:DUF4097 and DUF4098 domain-containing protein YvlB
MKPKLYKIIIALSALLLSMSFAAAQQKDKVKEKAQEQEQEQVLKHVSSMAADPAVVITICLESGDITINGGDRREVRVSAEDGKKVTLRRAENSNASTPATRLEALVSDADNQAPVVSGDCLGASDMALEVPRGATVYVTTRDGDIDVSNVAEVRAESSSGAVSVAHVVREVEAASIDGDISVEESSGRMHLRSFSGAIEVVNAKMVEQNDFLEVKTTSGDVRLENVAQPHVEVNTLSGEVTLSGALARGGFYDLKTVSSDITLNMPESVVFQLTAKVSQGGEVITDFPLKYTGEMNNMKNSVYAISAGKISGTYGTGAASSTINLVSFNGTLRLRKQ